MDVGKELQEWGEWWQVLLREWEKEGGAKEKPI